VVGIGHGVKEITQAMVRQAEKISFRHGSQFTSEASIELAAKLIRLAPEGMAACISCPAGRRPSKRP